MSGTPGTRLRTSPPGGEQHHARGVRRNIARVSTQPKLLGNATGVAVPHCWRSQPGEKMLRTHWWTVAATPKQGELAQTCAGLFFWGCLRKRCCCWGWRVSPEIVWQRLHRSGIRWLLCGIVWLIFSSWKRSTFILSRICAYSRESCSGVNLILIKWGSGGRKDR